MPHNYGKKSNESVTPETKERRSSPLFLHIHQLHDSSFVSLSIFLPTLFLPDDEKINAGGKTVESKINYNVITKFLDGSDQNNRKRFPKKEIIIKGGEV